jgi:hypothetical protein
MTKEAKAPMSPKQSKWGKGTRCVCRARQSSSLGRKTRLQSWSEEIHCSGKNVIVRVCATNAFGTSGERRKAVTRGTYSHSKLSSSHSWILLNRESRKALISAYSAIPSRSGIASKLPMQPLRRDARPGRDERVLHVTNNGLSNVKQYQRVMSRRPQRP